MKTKVQRFPILLTAMLLLAAGSRSPAQEAAGTDAKAKEAAAASRVKAAPTAAAELEAKFIATLTKATLAGRWSGIKDGQLTPDKEDKYTIIGVKKVSGDSWIVSARMQYGKQDFVAPIPVQVKWAGDTPVITLDNVGIPGGNSYSARVLIHGDTYAGSWSGGTHAGLMSGIITREQK